MKISLPLSSIEALESRIAPAAVVFLSGSPGHKAGEIDYTDADSASEDALFINTEENPSDPISALVGGGVEGVADTFYIKLTQNSLLKVFGEKGFRPLISGDGLGNAGISGTLVAFFVDKNLDNEVQPNELSGLALGKNVQAVISGSIDGDVVSNFNDALGKLGGAGGVAIHGDELLNNPITSLTISGNVNGNIMSGGQIGKLSVAGSVKEVLAGNAASGVAFDFNGALAGGGAALSSSKPAPGIKGVSILNASLGGLGLMRAGDGGAGAGGGALSNITVSDESGGLFLRSGDGGAGSAARHDGGPGGLISGVLISGLGANETDNSVNSFIQVVAGDGGANFAGSTGLGGAGGSIQQTFVGYEEGVGKSAPHLSQVALNDAVLLHGGTGGDGRIGGAGGAIKNAAVFASPTGVGNDLRLLGGNGGAANLASSSAKAGAGGSISGVSVLNPGDSLEAQDSKIVIAGGNAGSAAAGGAGNLGGAVSGAEWTGWQILMRGGDGSEQPDENGEYISATVVQESWQAVHSEVKRGQDRPAVESAGSAASYPAIAPEPVISLPFSLFANVELKSSAVRVALELEPGGSGSLIEGIDDAIAKVVAGKPRR